MDVFNSVNGKATATDGSEYKVRAWADLIVEDGVPQGDPEDIVGFEMTEIKRCIEPGPEEGVAVASERLRCRRPLNPQEGEARIR